MTGSLQYRSQNFIKLLIAMLAVGCIILLTACNNAEEVIDESTLGSNDAPLTNDDKIERNSMDDVADASKEDDNGQVVTIDADQ